jgi:hypothetical protein
LSGILIKLFQGGSLLSVPTKIQKRHFCSPKTLDQKRNTSKKLSNTKKKVTVRWPPLELSPRGVYTPVLTYIRSLGRRASVHLQKLFTEVLIEEEKQTDGVWNAVVNLTDNGSSIYLRMNSSSIVGPATTARQAHKIESVGCVQCELF